MNIESLLAYIYLWASGFCSEQEYNNYLHKLFLKNSDNNLLLTLEECSDNYKRTINLINSCFENKTLVFDIKDFGNALFINLKKVYNSNSLDITEFGKRIYKLWNLLPENLKYKEPFCTLNYADDALSFGDEKQTRELYENAFNFFNN